MGVYLYRFVYVLYGSNSEVCTMKYLDYRKKLRQLGDTYIQAYKKYGFGDDITRNLRQQKRDFVAKNSDHSYRYSLEILTGKGAL